MRQADLLRIEDAALEYALAHAAGTPEDQALLWADAHQASALAIDSAACLRAIEVFAKDFDANESRRETRARLVGLHWAALGEMRIDELRRVAEFVGCVTIAFANGVEGAALEDRIIEAIELLIGTVLTEDLDALFDSIMYAADAADGVDVDTAIRRLAAWAAAGVVGNRFSAPRPKEAT